ncbi:hypothetical protein N7462_004474 [Penicillium macrosclerotiorum]|uniref:uncharacterized protein n=1 Tax=Penicillium macrosclerotiorum TaxID=303699 RepID=UPI002549791C|nr:uncharacterized protein N7462_004474 [Penicillium macrosclerotiorum]KAJ5690082.1 hypothetical protein N7462_004474 [Penicillium macrosclerotiorum]
MASNSSSTVTAETLSEALPTMAMATQAIHADDFVSSHRAIAPPLHLAVNYRYSRDPEQLVLGENKDPNAPNESFVYSRYSGPNSNRFETVLKNIFKGGIMTYSTGLAAFHAIMVLLNPKRVFIGDGYHGVHGNIDVMAKLTGVQKLSLDQLDQMGPGDLIHIETPVNPTGEARNLAFYSAKAHAAGAYISVDATFGPPPLQDPLQFGADIVLHSGTKYIGGHSDMMCGILVVHPDRVSQGWLDTLYSERLVLGNVMGNLEGWLGLRSLRTLQLRVKQQSQTAERLVNWIHKEMRDPSSVVGRVVDSIRHASLQEEDLEDGWLQQQMAGGFGPVFAIWLKSADHAKRLPSKLFIFQHATSLGDVESLIEWRAMSDATCDPRLLRISCGLEDAGDLQQDLLQGFQALSK